MFESLLRIPNLCWPGGEGQAPYGRFASASLAADGSVRLERDRLGLNKLFLAVHESGKVVAANYLIDLVRRDVPFEAIYSVPSGHAVRIVPQQHTVEVSRSGEPRDRSDQAAADVDEVARDIRAELECWLCRFADQFRDRRIAICLSGGLDSGIIAALAKRYFPRLTAYTYSFAGPGLTLSEDAVHAERLARLLGIPFRLVPATADDLLGAVDAALCHGQDWRDFNVHCAIVNEIVARAIRRDADDNREPPPVVLTGDLANEFLADYEPVSYGGEDYYKLPRLSPYELRRILIRGLDSGDREVGVFSHHGLDVVQPYGLIAGQYERLPAAFIGGAQSKQALARKIAGDLLPSFLFDRPKVRAQVGDATARTGILPLLIQNGQGAAWLREAFCRIFNIERVAFLDRFIRGGRYRSVRPYSQPRLVIDGYVAG